MSTNAPDYAPGDSVIISGSGFWAGETVEVHVDHEDTTVTGGEGHDPWEVTADGSGSFETYWIVPYDDNVGEVLVVTAQGQSSGLAAETSFQDNNTTLELINAADSLCAGDTVDVCALLQQKCGGSGTAPLPDRSIIFFVNAGNCGADVGQLASDTAFTDSNGIACATLVVPTTPGSYTLRAKFRGEEKPSPCPMPGNSACDPYDPSTNKRCIKLSNANACEPVTVTDDCCRIVDTLWQAKSITIDSASPVTGLWLAGFFTGDPDDEVTFAYDDVVFEEYTNGMARLRGLISVADFNFTGGPGPYASSWHYNVHFQRLPDGVAATIVTGYDASYRYYILLPAESHEMVNVADSNDFADFWMYPADSTMPFQVGVGANGFNGNFGAAGWVNYIHDDNGTVYGDSTTHIVNSDFGMDLCPGLTCPGDTALEACIGEELCLTGFECHWPICTVEGGTLSGDTVCFTATEGVHTIRLIGSDTCGNADTCVTDVTISSVPPPVATCPSDIDPYLVCDLSPICVSGFVCTDADSAQVIGGTLSGDTVCFTPVAGPNEITLICYNNCGEADTCTTTINVELVPAASAGCPSDTSLTVCDLSPICLPGFGCSDADSSALIGGTLSGDTACFTPVAGSNTLTLICYSACGTDTCTTEVDVTVLPAATASCPGDTNLFLCDSADICLPGFTCSGGTTTVIGGTLSGDTVCFAPAAGENVITLICENACGADTCTVTVGVTFNSPPVAFCPGDTSIFVCDLETPICLTGFGCTDPDGNIMSSTVMGGTLSGDTVCFTPVEGANVITLVCADSCGGSFVDTCVVTVTVGANNPPVATCPGDTSLFVCDLSEICLPGFGCSDPDGNLTGTTVLGGTLSGDTVCFTPVAGPNEITLIGTDACGGADTCVTVVTVTVNSPPVTVVPNDTTLAFCELAEICLPGFGCTDPDGNILSGVPSTGTLSGDTLCFTPVAGPNVITLICTDSCGAADTATVTVTVEENSPPMVMCPGDVDLFVCDLSEICLPGFGCTDPDGNLVSSSVNVGTLSGDTVCFTPVAGANEIIVSCTDACGAVAACTTIVDVTLNSPPVVTCPGDTTLFVCDLRDICLPGFSATDPDGNLDSCWADGGSLSNDSVCFTPVEGTNVITVVCVDSCGGSAVDSCVVTVEITLNSPPVAQCPGDQDLSVCNLSDICLPGFMCSDPDGNIMSSTVTGGTLSGDTVCFTPVEGANVITLICEDMCGAADTCQTTVNVTLLTQPVAQCPGDQDTLVCDLLADICIGGFSATGGTPSVLGGTLNAGGDTVCITNPVQGTNTITYIVSNACGADTCQVDVQVDLIPDPELPQWSDRTQLVCDETQPACISLPSTTPGVNGFSCQIISGPGAILGGPNGVILCYSPPSLPDTVEYIVECSDDCGLIGVDTFTVVYYTTPECDDCPEICIDTLTAMPGEEVELCIHAGAGGLLWGGFDFLINYDASMLTFLGAEPGNFLIDCDWEYFTYRLVNGPAGTGGLVRLVAIADMNNSNQHPSCFTPEEGDAIACLSFRITHDWTLACLDAPVQFWWLDCGDNTISDLTGDTLYMVGADPGSIVSWEGIDLTGQPGVGGPPLPCPSDKYEPKPCTRFCNGKIKIICPGEIDLRGDLNLNNVAYEISDAVLYSLYFMQGPGAFTINPAGQTAASDVNADGVTLTVSDLVYLIRVITGDALPISENILETKVAAVSGTLQLRAEQRGGNLAVYGSGENDIGAALFIVDLDGAQLEGVTLGTGATQMDIRHQLVGDELRVLVYSIEDRQRISAGTRELISVHTSGDAPVKLMSVEAATFDGHALETDITAKVVPTSFALHQNYPNPFNPSTSFAIDLPRASDYTLTVYNIAGQVVKVFAGQTEAGTLQLTWNGADQRGAPVASGVYFYAFEAGEYHDVRKMVLMK